MNSKTRIETALKHQESDRVPRDLGGTESSGITTPAYNDLNLKLERDICPKIFEPFQNVCYVDNELLKKFKIDTVNLTLEPKKWKLGISSTGFEIFLPEKWNEQQETNGSTIVLNGEKKIIANRPSGGFYFDSVNPPLIDVNKASELQKFKNIIQSFDVPEFADETLEDLVSRTENLRADGRCVVFNLCCHLLAAGQILRGFENFMVDLMCEEIFVETFFDILIQGYIERIAKLADKLKDKVDVILLNDDLGTQAGPMISPDLYRKMIKPYQKKLFNEVKKKFNKPILFHSCGSIREFIPDLIELGVDALNPVQMTAEGMNLKELKKDFGDVLTFWGGGINTQNVLNNSSVSNVKDAVKRNVDILAPGGGFVFCQVHNIQPDVPSENIMAMYDW